ncbi:hypothetical protein BDA99DRAFT_110817 [Phascolomyces articulosus]|uniref:Uncharacterized protein n=1 Tax=Phascolomyces articulosus TaxID=60185 RepID=A0AAD5PC11_9FUNG|nr:hypothetical protein BDA99DRAFT_110817 [Phascolomyces articulosus]
MRKKKRIQNTYRIGIMYILYIIFKGNHNNISKNNNCIILIYIPNLSLSLPFHPLLHTITIIFFLSSIRKFACRKKIHYFLRIFCSFINYSC